MSRYRLCQHVMDDGRMCHSPAMRRRSCCYFHTELRRRRKRMAKARLVQEGVAMAAAARAAAEQAELERIFLPIRNLIDNRPEFKDLRDILCLSPAE